MTRQAARKVIEGPERRGYVRTERDARDTRVVNVILTPTGTAYAQAVVGTLYALNREFSEGVDGDQLAAASAVLRAVIAMDSDLRDTGALIRPPRQTSL